MGSNFLLFVFFPVGHFCQKLFDKVWVWELTTLSQFPQFFHQDDDVVSGVVGDDEYDDDEEDDDGEGGGR